MRTVHRSRIKLLSRIYTRRLSGMNIDLSTPGGRETANAVWFETVRTIDRILQERKQRRARLADGAWLERILQ